MLDFTIALFQKMCKAIVDSDLPTLTIGEYLTTKKDEAILVRHDIDRRPKNALQIARIEKEFGLRGTYYFRAIGSSYCPEIIKCISEMGHEVGLHYENLSRSKGNLKRAEMEFRDQLAKFRELASIRTVCMHGAPFSKWDNRDFWMHHSFEEYGLAGDAYLSVDKKKLYYFTDTGRSWLSAHNIRDRFDHGFPHNIRTTNELIRWIDQKEKGLIYISTHPERWESGVGWIGQFLTDTCTNLMKSLYVRVLRP